jgi:regulator of sigma E protease
MDVLTHSILPFAGILLGLIVLHEAGHYITAKMFGVKVLEAGIGLPPRIWGFTWRGTDYTLNAIPMGAFVRMLGEEDPSDPESLAAAPKWKRTIIIGSGAFLNLIAAIALFSLSLMLPREVSVGGAQIASVAPGSPAAEADLRPGDEIVEINGRRADNTGDASYLIQLNRGETIDFTIKREDPSGRTSDEILEKSVYARWDPPTYTDECGIERRQGPTGITIGAVNVERVDIPAEDRAEIERQARRAVEENRERVPPDAPAHCLGGAQFGFDALSAGVCSTLDPEERAAAEATKAELFPESSSPCYVFRPPQGIVPVTETTSKPPWEAVPDGARLAAESVILTRNQIWILIRGFNGGSAVTGPVGIAQATGEVVDVAGWRYLIEFAASISMSLAILNFLPIPMVDGGRLVFIAIEFVRRGKRIAPEKEALVHFAGLVAMLLAFVVITYFDIVRIINGDSLLR